jgi:hypothetical protein
MSKVELTITGMRIGEYSVPVPSGLSELINRANAWSLQTEKPKFEGYHREVVKKDGKLFTIFTKVSPEKKKKVKGG